MISIPIAVYNGLFEWQLDLFWRQHKKIYGNNAYKKAFAVIIERNRKTEKRCTALDWNIDIPNKLCLPHFDCIKDKASEEYLMPMNIQVGLCQIIDMFDDEEVIELLDCDMFHIKPFPEQKINDNEFFVSAIYEDWHLKSLTDNKYIIKKYLKKNNSGYNGGFVPIIGKVKTYKKMLKDWINLHIKIAGEHLGEKEVLIRWWSGMYSFQVACANNNIKLIDRDWVHIPPTNSLSENHYICHYSCDNYFNKKKFPRTNPSNYPKNKYYDTIREWLNEWNNRQKTFKMFL